MFKLFKSANKPTVTPSARTPDRSPAPRHPPQHTASSPVDWPQRRVPLTEADLRLSPHAEAWLFTLPPAAVPHHLVQRFARIVNRFALIWPDAVLTDRYFDSLIIDRRSNRQGFPAEVMADLIRLRAFHVQSRPLPGRGATGGLAMETIDFS